MGAENCKCRCAEGGQSKEPPLVLPPAEDFNAVRVSIESSRGYDKVHSGPIRSTYCTCKIPGQGELLTTPASADGKYDFEGELQDYKAGDPLLFQVWADEEAGKALIGKAQLPGDKISKQDGFEGEISLEETKNGVAAFLRVRVEVFLSDPAGLGVLQQPALTTEKPKEEPPAPPPVEAPAPEEKKEKEEYGVWVTFLKTQGTSDVVKLKFTKAPLGMSFDADRMPIVVNALNGKGQAKELGVQPGMVITEIGGENVMTMGYEEAYALMRDKVKHLPREVISSTSCRTQSSASR